VQAATGGRAVSVTQTALPRCWDTASRTWCGDAAY